MPSRSAALIVETATDPRSLVEAIKQQIQAEDKNIAFFGVLTLKQLMRYALWDDQIVAGLVGTLSLLGMFLAMVGLYGVVSYESNRRMHEFAVRMALGARPDAVLKFPSKNRAVLRAACPTPRFSGPTITATTVSPCRGTSENSPFSNLQVRMASLPQVTASPD